jgi:hypothetical protein
MILLELVGHDFGASAPRTGAMTATIATTGVDGTFRLWDAPPVRSAS